MRLIHLSLIVLTAGCVGSITEVTRGEGASPDEAGADGWQLSLDTSPSDVYLPLSSSTAVIRGGVVATEGVDRVEVEGAGVTSDAAGVFERQVDIAEGLSRVEVMAYDRAGNAVRGARSVLRAAYVPEGDRLDGSAVLAVNDALLAGLADSAAGALDGIDISAFAAPGSPLLEDDRCRLYVDNVRTGTPTLALAVTEDGRLRATARVQDIAVGFSGVCSALGQTIQVRPGSEADETTIELSMILEPNAVEPGQCLRGFTPSEIELSIPDFDLDLRLGGCGLLCLFGELVGELAEGAVRGMIEDRFGGMLDGTIEPLLEDLTVLDEVSTLDFLGTPVDLGLCLTGLDTTEGQLFASIGTFASGPGGFGFDVPGAPTLPALPPTDASAGSLLLDPGLVSQILFAVWNAGAFSIPDVSALGDGGGLTFTVDTLAGVVPPLSDLIDEGTVMAGAPLGIGVDATMAPLVRAATASEAAEGVDFWIELGDLRLFLGAGPMTLFELSTHVRLALALEPTDDGALAPVLIPDQSSAQSTVIDTAVPQLSLRHADALTGLVDGLVVNALGPLLADATIQLPDLGVPLVVTDVTPREGGYLEVALDTGAEPEPETEPETEPSP